jgi:hypothetical protein
MILDPWEEGMRVLSIVALAFILTGCSSFIDCEQYPLYTIEYDTCVRDGNPLYWLWTN